MSALNGIVSPSGGGSSTTNPAGFTNGYPSADNQVLRADGTSGAIQGSPLTSADWNGDLAGPVTTTQAGSVGAAFTNQPAGDTVTIVSNNAGDTTQQATIIYDLAGTVTYENITLNGVVPVTTVATMTHVLGISLDAVCAGTVTFKETSGGLTITTITTGNTSKGITTFTALSCYNRKVQVVADGATTKVVGLGGFDSTGATRYDLVTLSGTTKVLSNVTFATIVQIYAGDVEVARTPSINSIGYIHVDGGTVVTNTDVPPVSVDNTIARWNGVTGEALQGSALVVDDTTGNLTGPSAGFTITGGTGSGGTLTLDGSSHATDGGVLIASSLGLTGVVSASTANTTENNYNPTGFASCNILYLNPTGGRLVLTGLSGGYSGRVVYLVNNSATAANTINFAANNGSSSAANQFETAVGIDLAIGGVATLIYNGTTSRWVVGPYQSIKQFVTAKSCFGAGGPGAFAVCVGESVNSINGVVLQNTSDVSWTSGSADTGTKEVSLRRSSAAMLAVNTGAGTGLGSITQLANGVLLGKLIGANMNVTTDQAITITGSSYIIDRIVVTNASISLTTAAGGLYTASSKGGSTIVAAAQTYAALTASTKWINLTLDTTPTTTVLSGGTIYFSLTTAQGASSTSDIFVFGTRLS